MSAAKTITELRNASGMSQQALADALYVSRDLVSKWECGTRRPDRRMIEKIAEVFGVTPDDIVDKNDFIYNELADCLSTAQNVPEDRLIDILNAFLRRETPKNADVFIQRYYFQKEISEISDDYGIRENYVRSILSKTRKRLKKFLEESKR